MSVCAWTKSNPAPTTSADAQVFEWSQLQSGIFSHAVRSGLLGAADANLDDRITYDELEAFVTTASSGIRNSLYRTRLYARAPKGSQVLVDLRSFKTPAVTLKGFSGRLTVLQRQGARILDVNPEPGFEPRIHVPVAHSTLVAELGVGNGRTQIRELALGNVDAVTPEMMGAATQQARGSDEMFDQLFARPFGPQTARKFVREQQPESQPDHALAREREQKLVHQLQDLMTNTNTQRMVALLGIPLLVIVPIPTTLALAVLTWGAMGQWSRDTQARFPSLNAVDSKFLRNQSWQSVSAAFPAVVAISALQALFTAHNVLTLVALLPTVATLLVVNGFLFAHDGELPFQPSGDARLGREFEIAPSELDQDRAARLVAVMSGYDKDARTERIRTVALASAGLVTGTFALVSATVVGAMLVFGRVTQRVPPSQLGMGALLATGGALSVGLLALGVGAGLLLVQAQTDMSSGIFQAAVDGDSTAQR